jgi:hypothetical protein
MAPVAWYLPNRPDVAKFDSLPVDFAILACLRVEMHVREAMLRSVFSGSQRNTLHVFP